MAHEVWLRRLLVPRRGEAFIDVGAHVGGFSAYVAGRGRAVVAIEANPENFWKLCRALARHGAARPVWAAAWDRSGTVTLDEAPDMHTGVVEDGPGRRVQAIRLDDMLLGRVGVVKVDVEGAELRVLEGARRLLEAQGPDVVVETHEAKVPGVTVDVVRFLEARGYRVMLLHETGLTGWVFASRRLPWVRWAVVQLRVALLEPVGFFWRARKGFVGSW